VFMTLFGLYWFISLSSSQISYHLKVDKLRHFE
jgi:hypothetical protein